jgi:hypothetical protein
MVHRWPAEDFVEFDRHDNRGGNRDNAQPGIKRYRFNTQNVLHRAKVHCTNMDGHASSRRDEQERV